MEFESPDVEKDFPGLYASESGKKSNESDFSDEAHEKISKKDLLIGKRKDKKDTKKDLRYATLEGESSPEEEADVKSPSKVKKSKPFKFPSAKKEKREKSREKDGKEKEADKEKEKKKEKENDKDKKKEGKVKSKLLLKDKKKLKHAEDSTEIAEEQPIFGVPLSVAVERSRCHDGVEIPLVVRQCIDHIQEAGLNTEGLYKVSGKSKVQALRRLYNQREPVNLAEYDVFVATSLLKTFLRELPELLLTAESLPRFEEAGAVTESGVRISKLQTLVNSLPLCNRHLLAWLVRHFESVTAHEKVNKMSVQGIATVMSPVLQVSPRLITAFLCHCDVLFPDCKLTKYVPPLSCCSPSSLPDTKEGILEELRKQESLLGQLHSEVHARTCTKDREEQLWEVQRTITQLKRKLRSLERTVESAQRSVEETDSSVQPRVEEDLNLRLQSPTAPNTQVVEAVVEKPDLAACSADSLEIQAVERSYQARREELALVMETEELTSLALALQAMVNSEKAEVAALRAKIRALGANPVHSGYLLGSLTDDGSSEAGRETALLQSQKQGLASALVEERLACVDLRVQVRLAQATKS